MYKFQKSFCVLFLLTQNCFGYSTEQHNSMEGTLTRGTRMLWSQLEGSGLVPVEVNVQDTVTELGTGLMQVWNNAQEWWQQMQSFDTSRPNKKPTTAKPIIPEYFYEEEIPVITNKKSTKNKLKKKSGQLKTNHQKRNPILSSLPKENMSQQTKHKNTTEDKPVVKRKKNSKKHKKVTKVIDYQNYYYFFMGLLGIWPQF